MIEWIIWYGIGLFCTSTFYYFEWRRGSDLTYGDIILALFFALAGPICVLAAFFIGIVVLLARFSWHKPVIKGKGK